MLVYKFRQLCRGVTTVLRGVNAMQSGWTARSEGGAVLKLHFRWGILLTGMTQTHRDPQEGDPLGTITLNRVPSLNNLLCGEVPNLCLPSFTEALFIFFASVGEEMDAITTGPRKSNICQMHAFSKHLLKQDFSLKSQKTAWNVYIVILLPKRKKLGWSNSMKKKWGLRLFLGVGVEEMGRQRWVTAASEMKPLIYNGSLSILWPEINWCTCNIHLICLITICSHAHHRALLQMIAQPRPLGEGGKALCSGLGGNLHITSPPPNY